MRVSSFWKLFLVVVAICLAAPSFAADLKSDLPAADKQHKDDAAISQSKAAEPDTIGFALGSKWTAANLGQETSADGIYTDSNYIYVASTIDPRGNAKVRLDNGQVCWTHPGESFQPSYPVSNGQVVAYGKYYKPGIVILDDKTGDLIREIPTKRSVRAGLTFSGDVAYASCDDHNIYAVEWATGKIRWKAQLGAGSSSRPLVMGDKVVAGCDDGYLYFIDPASGSVTKKIDCTGVIWHGPVFANNLLFVVAGTLPIGRPGHKLTSQEDSELVKKARSRMLVIDPADGRIVSEFEVDRGYEFASKVVIRDDQALFFDHRTLYCYDTKARKLVWQLDPPGVHPSPVLLGNNILLPFNRMGVEGQHGHKLVVVDSKDGKVFCEQVEGGQGMNMPDEYVQWGDTVILTRNMQAFNAGRAMFLNYKVLLKEDWRNDRWVQDSLMAMQSIRPGMTRADLMKVFEYPGGLWPSPCPTYEFQGCRFFKVDVTFKHFDRDADGRAIEKPTDVIETISKPYLGEVAMD